MRVDFERPSALSLINPPSITTVEGSRTFSPSKLRTLVSAILVVVAISESTEQSANAHQTLERVCSIEPHFLQVTSPEVPNHNAGELSSVVGLHYTRRLVWWLFMRLAKATRGKHQVGN
jgi:hypothetical protein